MKRSTIEFECKISFTTEDDIFPEQKAEYLKNILNQYLYEALIGNKMWKVESVVPKRILNVVENEIIL